MSFSFIVGGLNLRDTHCFYWKIENFMAVVRDYNLTNAQAFEFRVGGNDPKISSRWTIYLKTGRLDNGKIVIGVYYQRAADCDCDSTEEVKTECSYAVKNRKTKEVLSGISDGVFGPLNSQRGDVYQKEGTVIQVPSLQDFLDHNSLTIHCTFKLFTKYAGSSQLGTVQGFLEQFHEKSKAEAQSLFSKLSEKTSSWENVTVLTMGNVEIKALKDMLAVRSPVFEAMFRSNMKEETAGVIELQEFTADAVRVILHFIHTGELLPNWSNMDILLQLANAAEKYQFPDLLDFFDCILPSLCDEHTAKPLLQIAIQLRLKKAKVGIVEFFRKRFEEKLEKMQSAPDALESASEDFSD